MKRFFAVFMITLLLVCFFNAVYAPEVKKKKDKRFAVLVLAENGGHHILYSKAAKIWLDQLAEDSNFSIEYIANTDSITSSSLRKYQLFIQLDFPPYAWTNNAVSAFQEYIEKGKIGWIGFHHASLLGEFDGYSIWQWFSNFMGGIRYVDYIPGFARAQVNVEDHQHPAMRGVPDSFIVYKDEWYIYDKSPRQNVHVLASVDESSYQPQSTIKMGDHPVVWTNEHFKARNIYIFMGHSPDLFDNQAYKTLFRNAIFWAADR
jgi:type 1 glutamine amidotransferase